MKTLYITLLCLWANVNLSANSITLFSINPEEFLDQIEEFILSSKSPQGKELISDLRDIFDNNKISSHEFEELLNTSNLMQSEWVKVDSYFIKYFESVILLKRSKFCHTHFSEWNKAVNNFIIETKGKSSKPIKELLDFSILFFKDGTLHFSKSGTKWSATLEDFKINYAQQQPQIYFEKTKLTAQSKKGEIQIVGTSGTFFPLKNNWEGKGGKAPWKDVHPELEEVYCELTDYQLNTKNGFYTAENVYLFYPKLFPNQKIQGKLENRVMFSNIKKTSSYPRFESVQTDLVFKDFVENGTLTGGIKLMGSDLQCFGNEEIPATWIQTNESGKKHFEIFSKKINVKNQKGIFANDAVSKIFFEEDFIYHPSVRIKYSPKEKTINLTAESDGRPTGPFYDAYHQVLIYSPRIDVKFDEKEIIINQKKFNVGNKTHRVSFQSADLWNQKEFAQIKSFSKVSPIILMAVMAKREKKRNFKINEVIEHLRLQEKPTELTSLFVDLMNKGFIIFFPDRKEIQVLDKAIHYFDVKEKEKDFDQFIFDSNTEKTNAIFDMEKKEIEMNGVQFFEFSCNRKVAVQPLDEKMILKKNRGIDFAGNLIAGKTLLQGRSYHFDYEHFHIVMDSIDHIEIFKEEELTPKGGKKKLSSLGSKIEGVSGVLRIDTPENKAGKESDEAYPKFESIGSSYVYYDSKEMQEGKLSRDSFYFELDKFSINDMNDISEEELKFKGRLFSSEIFPTIEAVLEVQADGKILGFQKDIGPERVPLYSGKGAYKGFISLDKNGLQGKGKVAFQTTTFDSELINFSPKQLNCSTTNFQMKSRGGKNPLPEMHGKTAKINWLTHQDSMYIFQSGESFKLFSEGSHEFEGQLILTSDSLAGNGLVSWDVGSLESEEIRFSKNGIQSNFANLEFRQKNEPAIGINSKGVNADIRFDTKLGLFKSQKRNGTVEFPLNQYKTTLLDFNWDMGNQTVTFQLNDEIGIFTSTHPEKNDLSFEGKKGIFSLESGLLNVEGVNGIASADAWIEPNDGKVTVDMDGEIQKMEDATILVSRENKYHVFDNAQVVIFSKNEFMGKGNYDYISDGKTQIIQNLIVEGHLLKEKKKENHITKIHGEILPEANFFIKEKINYRGEVTMNSKDLNIHFRGFGRMQTSGENKMHWFEMEHHSQKKDSTIAFSYPKNPNGEKLFTGIFINRANSTLYPRVMMPLLYQDDRPIFEAVGVLKLAEDKKSFWLGDSTKVASPQNLGNAIQVPMDASQIKAIGGFNMDTNLNPIKLKMVGKATIGFTENETIKSEMPDPTDFEIKALAGLSVPLPKSLMNVILADIHANNFDTPSNIQNDREFFLNTLPEFLNDPKELSKVFRNLTTNQLLELPEKENKHTFLLSNLDLKWDRASESFRSSTSELGLVSINGVPVNNVLTGYLQIKLAGNENDKLFFYLTSPSGNYFYIGYSNGVLETFSNNEKYNELVLKMKKRERLIKLDNGDYFEIILAYDDSASNFLNRMGQLRND